MEKYRDQGKSWKDGRNGRNKIGSRFWSGQAAQWAWAVDKNSYTLYV
jgi:hypothetical protein